jgi:hypothetical protein
MNRNWSGWDGVGTAAVTLVGPIACFTRAGATPLVLTLHAAALQVDFCRHAGRAVSPYYFLPGDCADRIDNLPCPHVTSNFWHSVVEAG